MRRGRLRRTDPGSRVRPAARAARRRLEVLDDRASGAGDGHRVSGAGRAVDRLLAGRDRRARRLPERERRPPGRDRPREPGAGRSAQLRPLPRPARYRRRRPCVPQRSHSDPRRHPAQLADADEPARRRGAGHPAHDRPHAGRDATGLREHRVAAAGRRRARRPDNRVDGAGARRRAHAPGDHHARRAAAGGRAAGGRSAREPDARAVHRVSRIGRRARPRGASNAGDRRLSRRRSAGCATSWSPAIFRRAGTRSRRARCPAAPRCTSTTSSGT